MFKKFTRKFIKDAQQVVKEDFGVKIEKDEKDPIPKYYNLHKRTVGAEIAYHILEPRNMAMIAMAAVTIVAITRPNKIAIITHPIIGK